MLYMFEVYSGAMFSRVVLNKLEKLTSRRQIAGQKHPTEGIL